MYFIFQCVFLILAYLLLIVSFVVLLLFVFNKIALFYSFICIGICIICFLFYIIFSALNRFENTLNEKTGNNDGQ